METFGFWWPPGAPFPIPGIVLPSSDPRVVRLRCTLPAPMHTTMLACFAVSLEDLQSSAFLVSLEYLETSTFAVSLEYLET